ncbi:MAG: hypothetical protein JWP97_5950 [Labilithrix sp.]|nr:hypothetical protein [Labilithrix sp.]
MLRHLLAAALLVFVSACRTDGAGRAAPPAIEAPDAAPATTSASAAPEASAPEPPVAAVTVDVAGDLPVYVVPGRRGTAQQMVFFHGACTHGLGYIQAFAFAASARGTILALQGEHDCGHGLRSWTSNAKTIDARVRAGFSASGVAPGDAIVAIGYSQGANVAESLAATFPATYRRLVLIGAPRLVDAQRLGALEGAVMMAGTFDNPALMRESARLLLQRGVPATYVEIPKARHGQLLDGEDVMGRALAWLDEHARARP